MQTEKTRMEYHHIDPDDIPPSAGHPCDRRSISEMAELGVVSVNRYDLDPGEALATTYHYHAHREEVFIVLDGTLFVETPDDEFAIETGETFVVLPNSPIRPYNPPDAENPVRVFGVGAPQYDIGRPYDPDSPPD